MSDRTDAEIAENIRSLASLLNMEIYNASHREVSVEIDYIHKSLINGMETPAVIVKISKRL